MNVLRPMCDRVAARVAVDPVVIVAVISALVQLVQICLVNPSPERIARRAKLPRPRHLRAMRSAVASELVERGYGDRVDTVLREVRNEFATMDVDQFAQIMLDAQDQTGDYQ